VISTLFGDMQYKVDDPGLFISDELSENELLSVIQSAFGYESDPEDRNLIANAACSSRFEDADILGDYLRRE